MSNTNKPQSSGVRYTDAQKKEIVDFVVGYNQANIRGGQSIAVKKYKVSPITIAGWLKAHGVPVVAPKAAKTETAKKVQAPSKATPTAVKAAAKPAVKAAAKPAVKAAAKPAVKPAVKAAAKPTVKPAVKPAAKPAVKAAAKVAAAKPVEAAKEVKPADKAAADKSKLGVRYSNEKKQEVVDFVNSYNKANGRGGQNQAAKKYSLSVITVSSWLKASANNKGFKGIKSVAAKVKSVQPAKSAKSAKAPGSSSELSELEALKAAIRALIG